MRKFILKNAMAVAAMVIATGSYGLMSFGNTDKGQEEPSLEIIQTYVLWDLVGNDPTNPDHYERAPEPASCPGGAEICQVIAPEDSSDPTGNTPDFTADSEGMPSSTVLDRINAALSGGPNETATKKAN